ncbi:DUF2784 domain-containing protein [Thiomonas sp.]|jgi:hypothetical protein|uniref:DUF2784 domain-containing protein n=1 Tax=Thiomonas sp. TaxID=2047785 RepID=UPI002636EB7E|nr:DUF2784 domain-containing protein [Thiomonas sp.]
MGGVHPVSAALDLELARLVLGIHVLVIGFNLAGLILVPIGWWRRWRWVRGCVWRAAHLLSMALVALQAALGRVCFLTAWQTQLMQRAGRQGVVGGLIQSWIDHVVFWNVPLGVLTVLYLAAGSYALVLWWWVPPRCRRSSQPANSARAARPTSGQSP